MSKWHIFKGDNKQHDGVQKLPPPPPWRDLGAKSEAGDRGHRATTYRATEAEINMVNAALYLRRPLLITGQPGTGKSSLAYAIAHELKLARVLYWPISTKSTLLDGLYSYDAIGRLQAKGMQKDQNDAESLNVENFLRLGPLGTALLTSEKGKPRVLLIDEIDKSDIDLPNDLLNVLEEGSFEIKELRRLGESAKSLKIPDHENEMREIRYGQVEAEEFPFVLLTSNGEREFPAAFLRRCLRLELPQPQGDRLNQIVSAHLGSSELSPEVVSEIRAFDEELAKGHLATDQLLNAVFMLTQGIGIDDGETRDELRKNLFQKL